MVAHQTKIRISKHEIRHEVKHQRSTIPNDKNSNDQNASPRQGVAPERRLGLHVSNIADASLRAEFRYSDFEFKVFTNTLETA